MGYDRVPVDKIHSHLNKILEEKDGSEEFIKYSTYCEGIRSKIFQANFALASIDDLISQDLDLKFELEDASYTEFDKVYFYTDAYWINIFSLLEIFSQLLNLILELGLQEQNISFAQLRNHLNNNGGFDDVYELLDAIYTNEYFSISKSYRHCSTHRRNIAIEEHISKVRGTQFTEYTDTVPQRNYFLVDDPSTFKPAFTLNRKLPDYLISARDYLLNSINDSLEQILNEYLNNQEEND
jgi:hypothetical protein